MIPAATTQATGRRRNPYRGPREFSRGDQLPNRRREAQELTDRVVAERVVLLHSPSGAGKTSLIEAAVVRLLTNEGFRPTPRLRVNAPVDKGAAHNRYIRSLVTYLLAGRKGWEPPDDLKLEEALAHWRADSPDRDDARTVLIIDQLEEILTLNPVDWGAKEEFFRELGALLKKNQVWALFSMREDYMGGLDPYLRFVPGCLRSRYRLDFLTRTDAILAMQVPAKAQRVDFQQDAAGALADRLAVITVQSPGRPAETVSTPYVEPFQLQVVCRMLWKNIRKHRGDDFPTIEVADVQQHADIDMALTLYFGETVASVAARTGADERTIRDWFEFELITKQHFRTQTLSPPQTADPQQVISQLEDGYLVRGDVRGLSTWYELAHDRLVGPVLTDNDTWRREHLKVWQAAAYTWNANDRQRAFLLQPAEISPGVFLRRGVPESGHTELEQAFLRASMNQARQNGALTRTRLTMSLLALAAVMEAFVIVALVIGLALK
jgi:hypothetical protein